MGMKSPKSLLVDSRWSIIETEAKARFLACQPGLGAVGIGIITPQDFNFPPLAVGVCDDLN